MSKLPGFRRLPHDLLVGRLSEAPERIQIVSGPRQVGKTTLVRQALEAIGMPSQYASADGPSLRGEGWIEAQWETARRLVAGKSGQAVLALDEIHKLPEWAEVVKRLWEEDRRAGVRLAVVLLGSAALPLQRGSGESLTGRFELIRMAQWSFSEMRAAFGFKIDEYLHFGGYPGAAALIEDEARWSAYMRDSILETTLSRDVLHLSRVDKPALLRGLLGLVCEYSSQIVSYQKMTGQLQDAGNTTTLAHYLDLLAGAGIAIGLEKYSGSKLRRRRSTPKLLALDTGLISAAAGLTYAEAQADREHWGRLVETAVGAHLHNHRDPAAEVLYWRERNLEVDFVVARGKSLTAIEVKAGRRHGALPGLTAFSKAYGQATKVLIGGDGIAIKSFLDQSPAG